MGILISIFIGFASLANITLSNDDFTNLVDLSGQTANLTTHKEKRLVYYWATWCPDCKQKLKGEIPDIAKSDKVEVIAISTDKDTERVKHFTAKEKTSIPTFRDPKKIISAKLNVFSVPYWAVLQKEGNAWKVIAAEAGSDHEKLMKALQ